MALRSPFFAPCVKSASLTGNGRRDLTCLNHGGSNRNSLRARSDGVRGIFHIRASHDIAVREEDGAADAEVGVWACPMYQSP